MINNELESMAKPIYNYWFLQFDFPDENGKPYKSSGDKMVWNEELKREIPEGYRYPVWTEKRGKIPYYGATGIMDYVDEAIFDGSRWSRLRNLWKTIVTLTHLKFMFPI